MPLAQLCSLTDQVTPTQPQQPEPQGPRIPQVDFFLSLVQPGSCLLGCSARSHFFHREKPKSSHSAGCFLGADVSLPLLCLSRGQQSLSLHSCWHILSLPSLAARALCSCTELISSQTICAMIYSLLSNVFSSAGETAQCLRNLSCMHGGPS